MHKVFKYELPIQDYFELSLPKGAEILKVGVQYDQPYLWALVDPEARLSRLRRFRFAGTGHPIVEDIDQLVFYGTLQMHGGALIFHVFEILS